MREQLQALGFSDNEITKLEANTTLAQTVITYQISKAAFVKIFMNSSLSQAEKIQALAALINQVENSVEEEHAPKTMTELFELERDVKKKLLTFGLSSDDLEKISNVFVMQTLVKHYEALKKLDLGSRDDLTNISHRTGAAGTIEALAKHGETLITKFQLGKDDLIKIAITSRGASLTIDYLGQNADRLAANKFTREQLLSLYSAKAGEYDGKTHAGRMAKLQEMGLLIEEQETSSHTQTTQLTKRSAATISSDESQQDKRPCLKDDVEIVTMPLIPGLNLEPVPGDGHCLYHAVALYCGIEQSELRQKVANYIEENIEDFADFIDPLLQVGQTIGKYLKDIRSGKEWADEVEIAALTYVLDRQIVVIDKNHKLRSMDNQAHFAGEPIFVFYNGKNHYDGLVLTGEVSAQGIYDNLLAAQRRDEERRMKMSAFFQLSPIQANMRSTLFQRPSILRSQPQQTSRLTVDFKK